MSISGYPLCPLEPCPSNARIPHQQVGWAREQDWPQQEKSGVTNDLGLSVSLFRTTIAVVHAKRIKSAGSFDQRLARISRLQDPPNGIDSCQSPKPTDVRPKLQGALSSIHCPTTTCSFRKRLTATDHPRSIHSSLLADAMYPKV
jgi:hypothetical protein